tara:strand:+ start:4261 stop:6102 length:1842 start_codon:yes stop_codon:yes gene_type:complete
MAIKRDIQYINKDFTEYRNQLINYSQTYFPTTYTDFTETSPGMMFIEQAAYVGDVLSFYLDNQVQENFLQYARQTSNIFDLAYMYGYTPKVTGLATTMVDFYQQIPSKVVNGETVPDFDYAVYVNANTSVSTDNSSQVFTIEEPIDFTVSSSIDPTTISVSQISNGLPTYYLLKKSRKAFSGTINTQTVSFGAPQEFATTVISATNIAGILDVTDTDGNKWYQVDYLGQEQVFDGIKNTNTNDPNTYLDTDAPYLLQTKQVQNRFATRFLSSTQLQLQFGAGTSNSTTEDIVPNPMNVGIGLPFLQNKMTTAYSPTNFVFSNTYGVAPSNTTLTIRYYTGGGIASNVSSNTLTNLNTSTIQFIKADLNSNTAQYVFNSLAATNPVAASGGQDGDTIEEIRQNSISNFSTQLRNVTQDDYLVRALSMDPKYGVIAKALTQKPNADDANTTLDIYVLTKNIDSKLSTASTTLKNNLKAYLNEYRMIGDTLSIKDAFIINFAIDFEIITYPNFNNNEVLERCIVALQEYFQIDKWQINQPIITPDLYVLLDAIDGVQTVKQINFTNKAGVSSGYSQWAYDMNAATQNGTIFPSLDPSIFELKYPNTDIKGRVVTLF